MRTVLLVLPLLGACAGQERDELRAAADGFDAPALEAGARAAYDAVLTADHFGGTTDTWRWCVKDVVCAALELERDALVPLAHRATPEGRLWAVWCLERADPAAFRALAPELRADATRVRISEGCFTWTAPASAAMARFVDAADGDELDRARAMLARAR